VDDVVSASGGSMRKAVDQINAGGLSQADAIEAMVKVTEGSGRNIGGVVHVGGGGKVITSVRQGPGQPIIHVAEGGQTTFGSADLAFSVDEAGELVTTVTNLKLP